MSDSNPSAGLMEATNYSSEIGLSVVSGDNIGNAFDQNMPSDNPKSLETYAEVGLSAGDNYTEDNSENAEYFIGNKSTTITVNENVDLAKPDLTVTINTEQESVSQLNEETAKQSSVLKLFAEDRFGKDAAGAAFFEQISSETKPGEIVDISMIKESVSHNITFSPDLSELEIKEICSSWIPCNKTKLALASITNPTAELYPVEKEMITTPTIILTDNIEDPVKSSLDDISQIGSQRKAIAFSSIPTDTEGLRKLIELGSYHSALNLTTTLLKIQSVGNTCIVPPSPESLQLWLSRIALLIKLKKFSVAEAECETFGNLDNPDLYYEFYGTRYPTKGCMVPFSLRLIIAEIPQYNENYEIALNKLFAVRHIVLKIIKNITTGKAEDGMKMELSDTRRKDSLNLWNWQECRVLYSILNCYLSQKDYIMAINVARSLLEKDKMHSVQLHSALGRIYLQLGDVKSAEDSFNAAFSSPGKIPDRSTKYNEIVNKALLAIALGDTEKAHDLYREALVFQPMDPLLVNNLSVCLLYMGKLKESLSLLEQAIHGNPRAYLHDSIMFNVSTLYELESSNCTVKKHALLKLVAGFADDGFSVSSLKIPAVAKT